MELHWFILPKGLHKGFNTFPCVAYLELDLVQTEIVVLDLFYKPHSLTFLLWVDEALAYHGSGSMFKT